MDRLPEVEEAVLRFLQDSREVCWKSGVIAGITGVAAGIGLGTFVGTLEGAHGEMKGDTLRQQLRHGFGKTFRQTVVRGYELGKGFGFVGLVYQTMHCAIERERAQHDLWNGVAAGFIAGAGFGALSNRKSGAQAIVRGAGRGAVGFAAFSLVIDWVMDHVLR
mmetsp:Transcript_2434/g.7186  ORF Transcript_2434/g.7186 Transcript_2434/m.7186 type:complete len:163 (+) Transcript_2434:3-491(+)